MDQTRPATADDYRQRILRVLVYIQRHLDEDFDLDTLASIAHFSPFHFHRVFTGLVGEAVREHVRRLRLERAAHRLKFTDDQVVRIAFEAGYEAHESFTRAFGAMFGESPNEFRARHRAVRYPDVPSGVHYAPDVASITLNPPGAAPMDIHVERMAPKRVAFVRHVGPYNAVGTAWARLFARAGPMGLGSRMEFFGLCHDDPDVTPPERVRYDACLVVGPQFEPLGDIGVQDVPGAEFATGVHAGPYSTLGRAYAAICGPWLLSSGRALGDPPCIEFYLNDPRSTPEDQLQTKVCMRLA